MFGLELLLLHQSSPVAPTEGGGDKRSATVHETAGHSRPKPSELEMAMVSLCLSSFLVRYGGRQI